MTLEDLRNKFAKHTVAGSVKCSSGSTTASESPGWNFWEPRTRRHAMLSAVPSACVLPVATQATILLAGTLAADKAGEGAQASSDTAQVWGGVLLRDVLQAAGVRSGDPGATHVQVMVQVGRLAC